MIRKKVIVHVKKFNGVSQDDLQSLLTSLPYFLSELAFHRTLLICQKWAVSVRPQNDFGKLLSDSVQGLDTPLSELFQLKHFLAKEFLARKYLTDYDRPWEILILFYTVIQYWPVEVNTCIVIPAVKVPRISVCL